MSGFGDQQWGLGPFGGLSSALTIVSAIAVSTHEVAVTLSKPPKAIFGLLDGDVRNVHSWELSVPATDQVLQVAEVVPYALPMTWLVRSMQRLPDSTGVARIKATTLRDAAGNTVQATDYADFAGITEQAISTPTAVATSKRVGGRDLQNISVPQAGGETSVGGVFVIRGGDYTLVEGVELLRKLIIRRLISMPGDFFHIPAYGVGLRVKQPIPGGDLVRLRASVERQIALEPDISRVVVKLTQSMNTLAVVVSALLARSGQQVTVALDSPIGQAA